MAAIDLYSGIGGWTLGFKMTGIPIIASFEWWKDANITHNKNFGTTHQEKNIRELTPNKLPDPESIDYVVGSPPCTQFSFANRGGKGNIQDGLVDICKFLEIVDYLKPRYWAMENVPRVAKILEKELFDGQLKRFKHLFGEIHIYNASDFGVPQDRKRMIAGNFPFSLLDSYKGIDRITLGEVIASLNSNPIFDPIYKFQMNQEALTDHVLEANLNFEEERINKESKTHHPVYNKMSFPENLQRPSRTVTALCTRVSRESIIIRDANENLRRLTIRERGSLQSFPISYQFFSNSYTNKIKMIGNAVPPLLTFYIAQAMLHTKKENLISPGEAIRKLDLANELSLSSNPENKSSRFPPNRSFWLAIKGLRFGSGIRFELRNKYDTESKNTHWEVNFFYGSSKKIKKKALDFELFHGAISIIEHCNNENVIDQLQKLNEFVAGIDENELQRSWTNLENTKLHPLFIIDELAHHAMIIKKLLSSEPIHAEIYEFVKKELKNSEDIIENKRLLDECVDVFVGILVGTIFNSTLEKRYLEFKSKAVA